MDIYRTFHPRTSNYTFFSRAHGTVLSIDLILGDKTSLLKFKKIEIIPNIFSENNALKLEINCKREVKKPTHMWRLNNMLLKN